MRSNVIDSVTQFCDGSIVRSFVWSFRSCHFLDIQGDELEPDIIGLHPSHKLSIECSFTSSFRSVQFNYVGDCFAVSSKKVKLTISFMRNCAVGSLLASAVGAFKASISDFTGAFNQSTTCQQTKTRKNDLQFSKLAKRNHIFLSILSVSLSKFCNI